MAPRFDDFVSSPFLSLFSHLVAPFIAARFSGGSFFAIFATPEAGIALGELQSLVDLYDFISMATIFLIDVLYVTPTLISKKKA
ncbi:hypothetical protein F2Q68_00040326 [Brassica cretica]|uniref:Uncharacterized protein n=1 Tax=Brassica cretica TaxID=69181 RepID=A0A8S9MK24_BRACR|nr:hypothetical protein F2Q68_00040326 [Brassica cretica]